MSIDIINDDIERNWASWTIDLCPSSFPINGLNRDDSGDHTHILVSFATEIKVFYYSEL